MDVKARKAIEALRCGVPNAEVVRELGCDQADAEQHFCTLLSEEKGALAPNDGPRCRGMLVSGGFGSGKSHLLNYLEQLALNENFVCSRVTISKETPLYDDARVFRAAVRQAMVPRRAGPLFEELCSGDWWNQPAGSELLRNTEQKGQRGELATMFAATLRVYQDDWDAALRTSIEGWWSGEKLRVADVRDALKRMECHRDVPCRGAKAHELPSQRAHFAADFIRARYRGWVLLLDELELIGQYSRLQRARSYAALSRWMGIDQSALAPEIVVVGAISDDYAAEKIGSEKSAGDRSSAITTLAARPRHKHLRDACKAGMQFIERNCIELGEPGEERNREILERLGNIYSRAYNWETPPATPLSNAGASWTKMRHRIRAPIEEWDILRMDPETTPHIIAEEERTDYTERTELEKEASE
ncbi:MAG: DUF2791 family P-loop domain-containing protein [Bryobacterales bacterium]|nr:DUF2791 family P-loop domain-containing protein [Bryobacterales bacterium]